MTSDHEMQPPPVVVYQEEIDLAVERYFAKNPPQCPCSDDPTDIISTSRKGGKEQHDG